MRKIILAVALAIGALGATAAPTAQAGGTCYPSKASRSGDYVTYSAYGTGNGRHRVQFYRNGFWTYSAWVYGTGTAYLTRYHPGYTSLHNCYVG